MRALTFQSNGHVSVETVDDPAILQPTDAVVRITMAAICGSDLHILHAGEAFGFQPGGRLGHEFLGTVEAVTVPRKWAVDRVDTFVAPTGAPWLDRAIGAAAPLLRWLPSAAATALALVDPGRAPADAEHADVRFAVTATARRGAAAATVTVSGSDVYATTAALASRLARALAAGALDAAGVVTPAQLVSGERALGATPELTISHRGP